ncbi:MAG: PAC2 family protein [Actinomyces sp.]|nr:MAG: PAC2 family protein [Actinomyces sp.]
MDRRAHPEEVVTLLATPELEAPALVVHFDGWIDAGASAAAAMAHLLEALDPRPVARFDTEWFVDHRARRPTMHVVEGVNRGLDWPVLELVAARDDAGRDVLLLHGAEPDHNWRTFVEAVVGLARRFGVREMFGLGAYPAAVPHTRPVRMSVTASDPDLARGPYVNATLDVPAGMESALEEALARTGIPTRGLWSQVPHYVATAPYAPATLALLVELGRLGACEIDTSDLAQRAMVARRRLDQLVAEEPGHAELVAQLEQRYDETPAPDAEIPSSDELAAEVERWLREHDEGDTP